VTSLRSLLGRPIVASDTAEQVGATEGVVVDPQSRRVVAVHVSGTKGGEFVGWDAVDAVGADAVMVSSVGARHAARGELETRAARGTSTMLGKRLLDDHGDELGTVDDVEFEADTGELRSLRVVDAEIDSARLLGVGSYAVVVRADDT